MPRNRVQHQKGLSDDAFERFYPDEEAEISPNVGDGLKDQAAAVWAFESAGLAATSIPSVNLIP